MDQRDSFVGEQREDRYEQREERHAHRGQLQLHRDREQLQLRRNQEYDCPEQHREAHSKQCSWIQGHERVNSNKAFMTSLTQQIDQRLHSVVLSRRHRGIRCDTKLRLRGHGTDVEYQWATEQDVTIQVGQPHDAMDRPRGGGCWCTRTNVPRTSLTRPHDDTSAQHRTTHRVGALILSHPWRLDHTGASPAGHPLYICARKGRLWTARPHTLVTCTTQMFNTFVSFFHFSMFPFFFSLFPSFYSFSIFHVSFFSFLLFVLSFLFCVSFFLIFFICVCFFSFVFLCFLFFLLSFCPFSVVRADAKIGKNRRKVPTVTMTICLCENSIFGLGGRRRVGRRVCNGPFESDPAFMFFISLFVIFPFFYLLRIMFFLFLVFTSKKFRCWHHFRV